MKRISIYTGFLLLIVGYGVLAEVLFKDNFIGGKAHSADVVWGSGVAVKPVDIDSIGIPESVNPAIKAGDFTGTGANGAARFTYKPDINSWSELRWTIASSPLAGRLGLQEVWLQFDLFIPENFHERDVDGHWGAKHIVLFGNTYPTPHRMIIGRHARDNTSGDAWQGGDWRWRDAAGKDTWYKLQSHADFNDVPIVDKSKDAGSWQRLTVHASMPTSKTSNDGICEFWIKHQDGEVVKVHNIHNGPWFTEQNGENYIRAGYLLGWSNPGFNEQTVFFIDNVIVAETSNHIDQAAIGKSASIVKPVFQRQTPEVATGMMVDVFGRMLRNSNPKIHISKCKVGGRQNVRVMVWGEVQ